MRTKAARPRPRVKVRRARQASRPTAPECCATQHVSAPAPEVQKKQKVRGAALVRLLLVLMVLTASGAASTLADDMQPSLDQFSIGANGQVTKAADAPPPPQGGFTKSISIVFTEYMRFLNDAVSNIFAALQSSFYGLAVSITALYIAIVTLNLIRGNIAAMKEFALSCFLVMGLTALVFEPGYYQFWIFDPFIGTVNDLSNFFVSKGAGVPIGSEGDIINYMGSTLYDIWTITDKMERNLSLWDRSVNIWLAFKVGFAQAALIGSYIACIAGYMYLILQAWFAIYMYMIIGGICLFFAAFKGTRFLAVAWFRSLCHEGLTIIFASLIMGISGNIIQKLMKVLVDTDVGSVGIFTPQYFAVLLASVMGFLMLLKAPQLASSLSGGSAGSTSGVAAAVGSVAGMGVAKMKSSWGGNKSGGSGGGRAGGGGGSLTPYSDAKGTTPGGGGSYTPYSDSKGTKPY